jgi:hypothetical protein
MQSWSFFAYFFASRQKSMWGLGQSLKNQWIMDNAQCTIDWFDNLSIYWWIPIIWGLRVFEPSWQIKVLPSRQGESCRFMPQNKFCGYENSAFQAGKHPGIQKYSSQWKPSIHRLTFAWKAITFITTGHDLRTKTSLPLLHERQNHCSCTNEYRCRQKANKQNENS